MRYTYLVLLLLILTPIAKADTIWTYQGTPMSPCACSLSGTFTLAADGVPVAWDFTDGTTTLTQADSTGGFNDIFGLGTFSAWDLRVRNALGSFNMVFYGSQFESNDWDSFLASGEQGAHGTLIDPTPTPEPSTGVLMLTGVVVFLLLKRRW